MCLKMFLTRFVIMQLFFTTDVSQWLVFVLVTLYGPKSGNFHFGLVLFVQTQNYTSTSGKTVSFFTTNICLVLNKLLQKVCFLYFSILIYSNRLMFKPCITLTYYYTQML